MKPAIVDRVVLLALHDPGHPYHEAAATAINDQLKALVPLVVPATVAAEVLVDAHRHGPHAYRTIKAFLRDLVRDIYPVDRLVAEAAAQYRTRHPALAMADAFVLGTRKVVRADKVLTTNHTWRAIEPAHIILITGARPAPAQR